MVTQTYADVHQVFHTAPCKPHFLLPNVIYGDIYWSSASTTLEQELTTRTEANYLVSRPWEQLNAEGGTCKSSVCVYYLYTVCELSV